MFCYQCEQTAKGTGCCNFGVCGKDPETAVLQDLLIYSLKGISMYAACAALLGVQDGEIDKFVTEGLFTTVTNVNFNAEDIASRIKRSVGVREKAKALYEKACASKALKPEVLEGIVDFVPAGDVHGMVSQGELVSVQNSINDVGEDITGLRQLVLLGLKGTAAYADHALALGHERADVFAFFHKALKFLAEEPEEAGDLLTMALEVGRVNLDVMELLDKANTSAYGNPVPVQIRITPVKGKAILVSGHDLKDLYELLKQTEGKGINIYTHGEMLPAHGYPELKKFKHLVGNYGGAWQEQRNEFDLFPGAILMTTNCIQKPKDSYKDRIFTCGLVSWPGVKHLENKDFSPLINAALKCEGFKDDGEEKFIMGGFGHNAVLSVADKVVEGVKAGAIKHFFLIGGCDGAKTGRDYYTRFAEMVPKDCVILTLACGKYRFNKLDFGTIGGIPRLLDIGQCNDAYSAIKIASALAGAFNCSLNELPLSMIISWYEQKAVCILLTLLYLGKRDIRLGPSLPAFITPAILKILVDKFNIMPIAEPEADLKAILKG
ncbi:MAG: hydroxylamine reductase [Lentisphaerae bacterium GWF2_45_14]|nr:MAG: hydroxylamine reductase [Lentisphaerae bacterium GWF2_45_14]